MRRLLDSCVRAVLDSLAHQGAAPAPRNPEMSMQDFPLLSRKELNGWWPRSNMALAALLSLGATLATPAFAQKPNIDAGRQIAAQGTPQGVVACVSCHGAHGEGMAAFPRLAGSGQAYLQAQLDAFGNGSRKNAVMQPMAEKLSVTERADVATYFSQLPMPFVTAKDAQALPADTGAWLATRGRWADQVPACAQCHGPAGLGVGRVPGLARDRAWP